MLMPLLYAGLAGTVFALVVATRQQNWSLRVLFLLGLRLAIGWHFLFEGLHKIHTWEIGPSETNKPFSSEMYFKVAPGPFGSYMRSKAESGEPFDSLLIGAKGPIPAKQFATMPFQHQAAMCPIAVAQQIDDLYIEYQVEIVKGIEADADAVVKAAEEAEAKVIADADAWEQRAAKGQWTADELERFRDKAKADRKQASSVAYAMREKARARNQSVQEAGRLLQARFTAMPAITQAIQNELDAIRTDTDKEIKSIGEQESKSLAEISQTEQRWLTGKLNAVELTQTKTKADADKRAAKTRTDAVRVAAKQEREKATVTMIERKERVKQKYAMWAYGVETRDTKLKGIAHDVPMSGPARLEHLAFLRKKLEEEEARLKTGLGNGSGIDQKKAAELRMDVITAESDFRKDIDVFVAEMKKELMGSAKMPDPSAPAPTSIQKMDKFTMWFLVAVGCCIMAGLFTRIACIAGCGFLLLTWLTHPPFPWYPLPPSTEGNPVFINKNVIEGLALLVLATFPTGRWLGLDALIARVCGCGRSCEPNA